MGVPVDDISKEIDNNKYILTLDYAMKMLNIHERCLCTMPVVIEGETGVGKTALLDMLQKLWSQHLLFEWRKSRDGVLDQIRRHLTRKCRIWVTTSTILIVSTSLLRI